MNDPKVIVRVENGFEFLRKCARRVEAAEIGQSVDGWDPALPQDGKFDVIITDNSQMDESGPANDAFYSEDYFKNVQKALRQPYGVLSSLGI